jgi:hypothetical protein
MVVTGQDVSTSGRADMAGPGDEARGVSIWRRALEWWKRVAHKIGVVQTRVVLILFFFIFVLPLGLLLRLLRDPLHFRHPDGTNWTPHPGASLTIESARRQF